MSKKILQRADALGFRTESTADAKRFLGMPGKHSRNKGARFEREVVNTFLSNGFDAKRIPLSGATWMKGDVQLDLRAKKLRLECKSKGSGFKFIYDNLGDNDALCLRADRQEPLIVFNLAQFIDLLQLMIKRMR